MVRKNLFRQDLYYRLNIIKLKLPALSERREDIPLLTEHFLRKFNLKKEKKITQVSDEVMQFLLDYSFPGNIRELENILEHAFILCRSSQIELNNLPKDVLQFDPGNYNADPPPLERNLQETELELIKKNLIKFQGHRGKTAQALGIDKSTLWRKMKRFGILNDRF
jgi:DNA-binding NtrC family response regulator